MTDIELSPHVVVLSGAGISAESGLQTFRDSDGLWEGYDVQKVATPEGWAADQKQVLHFYNLRREQVRRAKPNAAHEALVRLEKKFKVSIVTQNIDDLHERAGSSLVVHLHGEVLLARSSIDETLLYPLGDKDIHQGDTCELGSQLRPHVVWFGEAVPELERAARIVSTADILIVVGTSLVVYPAAGLIHDAPPHAKRYLVNPEIPDAVSSYGFKYFQEKACKGIPTVVNEIMEA